MTLSNYVVQQVLGSYFPTTATHYLALHIADPTTSGLASTEVSTVNTPVYARKPVAWSAPANRGVYNAAPVQWTGLPPLEIGFFGVWDALVNGRLLASLACAQPLVVTAAGQSIYLPPGALSVVLAGSPTQRALSVTTIDASPMSQPNTPAVPVAIETSALQRNNPALLP